MIFGVLQISGQIVQNTEIFMCLRIVRIRFQGLLEPIAGLRLFAAIKGGDAFDGKFVLTAWSPLAAAFSGIGRAGLSRRDRAAKNGDDYHQQALPQNPNRKHTEILQKSEGYFNRETQENLESGRQVPAVRFQDFLVFLD